MALNVKRFSGRKLARALLVGGALFGAGFGTSSFLGARETQRLREAQTVARQELQQSKSDSAQTEFYRAANSKLIADGQATGIWHSVKDYLKDSAKLNEREASRAYSIFAGPFTKPMSHIATTTVEGGLMITPWRIPSLMTVLNKPEWEGDSRKLLRALKSLKVISPYHYVSFDKAGKIINFDSINEAEAYSDTYLERGVTKEAGDRIAREKINKVDQGIWVGHYVVFKRELEAILETALESPANEAVWNKLVKAAARPSFLEKFRTYLEKADTEENRMEQVVIKMNALDFASRSRD